MITRDSLYRRLLTWLLLPLLALGGLMLFQAWLDARQTADRAFDRLLEPRPGDRRAGPVAG